MGRREDGARWMESGGKESLAAAASPLCILSPTNRAEKSAAQMLAPAPLSLPLCVLLPVCIPKNKNASSVYGIIDG